jgi:iron complex transport system substrate-binding protein
MFPAAVFVLAIEAAAASPAAVNDDTGHALRLKRPVQRIVSLAPSTTEMLFALGAGKLLVGVSSFDDYPSEVKRLPRIGSFSAPDLERIVAAHPDLVVAAFGNPLSLIDRLRGAGLPVYVSNPTNVAGVLRNMQDLGRLIGRETFAQQVVGRLHRRLDAVSARVAHRPRVSTLVVIWDEPLTVAGGRSFLEDILSRAGGTNAARSLAVAYPKLDPERLIRLDPAVVLFPVTNDPGRVGNLARRPGFQHTLAIRTGRVYSLNPDWLMRPGPRVVDGVEAVARRLHPEAFSNQARQ